MNNPNQMTNGNVTVMLANTVEEALKSWVPNNCTTFFMVFNESLMILRSTDFRGFPSQPRFFKMTEQFMQTNQIAQPQQTMPMDTSQFATKAEFEELKALIISSMNNPQPAQNPNQQQQRNNKGKGGNV